MVTVTAKSSVWAADGDEIPKKHFGREFQLEPYNCERDCLILPSNF